MIIQNKPLPYIPKYPPSNREELSIAYISLTLWLIDSLMAQPDHVMIENLNLTLEFGGGAELLFDNVKKHNIQLQKNECTKWTVKDLLKWIEGNMLKSRKELFIQGNSVRPGILVLINNTDWELMGELDYELNDNDCVLFISTLHGG